MPYPQAYQQEKNISDGDADAGNSSSDGDTATSTKSTSLAFDFKTGHPKSPKYQATFRSVRAVVDIIGPGFPCEAQRKGDDEKSERFAMSSMLMFVPHRKCSDLRSSDSKQSWEQAWTYAEQSGKACPSGAAFIRFNEDRWKAIFSNQEPSVKYYENIKDKLKKLQNLELREFHKAQRDDN